MCAWVVLTSGVQRRREGGRVEKRRFRTALRRESETDRTSANVLATLLVSYATLSRVRSESKKKCSGLISPTALGEGKCALAGCWGRRTWGGWGMGATTVDLGPGSSSRSKTVGDRAGSRASR